MNILGEDEYKKKIWKKGLFVISYYVKLFIVRLKHNINMQKFKRLRQYHFNIINDVTYMHGINTQMTFKDKLNAEYKNIVQASHTNICILK